MEILQNSRKIQKVPPVADVGRDDNNVAVLGANVPCAELVQKVEFQKTGEEHGRGANGGSSSLPGLVRAGPQLLTR